VLKVTFDSNVWEKLVSESQDYPTITERIQDGSISPYLCEIAISLESIQRTARQRFFKRYTPNFSFTATSQNDGEIGGIVKFGPNNELHPGLHPIPRGNLLKARDLGFRVLRMTNLGTVRSAEIPEDMLCNAEDESSFWAYAERLSSCSQFIKDMRCGRHVAAIKAEGEIKVELVRRRALERLAAEETKKQNNLETIYETIEQMDDDWIVFHSEKARLVSDDEMQTLWARVMASEAEAPGSYSKRTLETLSVLEKVEAHLFTSVCRFIVRHNSAAVPAILYDELRTMSA
jgi:hypothetical protein